MRSITFRYGDFAGFLAALSDTSGSLSMPEGVAVSDGEWVLAVFEVGPRHRVTAAAARGVRAAGDPHLEFERRDWERLLAFASSRRESPSSVRIPVAKPYESPAGEPPAEAEAEAPPSRLVPLGAHVLLVDESRGGGGDELRAMLTDVGLVVELVWTKHDAEARMQETLFDALVLDMHGTMRELHGFLGRVRSDARFADVPVLLVSAQPTSRDVVDAFASGCDDFLPKPFRVPELAARVFGLVRRARMARRQAGSAGR